MRSRLTLFRWITVSTLVLGAVLVHARSASSAPLQQTLTITAAGFVDVFPQNDPNCPGCNGVYDAEDRTRAENDPMPAMEFVVRNAGGQELGRQTTQNFLGVQRAQFDVPEEQSYTVELVADPAPWQLCPSESRTRTLTQADFRLGAVTVRFDFTQGCSAVPPPATATPGPSPTLRPGVTPSATPKATSRPGSGGDDSKSKKGEGPFGQVRGIAFIDNNADGKFEAGEPGLNDVRVNLGGGGLEVYQITAGDGLFNFPGLGVGKFDLFIDPGSEWCVTTAKRQTVSVNGNDVPGVDFGMIRCTDLAAAQAGQVAAAPRTGRRYVLPTGAGITLPSTGIAQMPAMPVFATLILVLGALAVVGYTTDRRNRRS